MSDGRNSEILPGYPHHPEWYAGRPDDDCEKAFFLRRGAVYEGGRYVGGFAMAPGIRPTMPPEDGDNE